MARDLAYRQIRYFAAVNTSAASTPDSASAAKQAPIIVRPLGTTQLPLGFSYQERAYADQPRHRPSRLAGGGRHAQAGGRLETPYMNLADIPPPDQLVVAPDNSANPTQEFCFD
jgi:hypothetical protein